MSTALPRVVSAKLASAKLASAKLASAKLASAKLASAKLATPNGSHPKPSSNGHGSPPSDRSPCRAELKYQIASCDLGQVLIAATPRGIARISLGDEREPLLRDLQQRSGDAELLEADGSLGSWLQLALAHVQGRNVADDALPLDMAGTEFQQRVWQALRSIPAGTTLSYAQLARKAGRPRAVRAVANACGDNPIAVVVPCHRVVRSDGGLGGYRWGIERKMQLLEREALLGLDPAPTSFAARR